jgi:hypothetical protein
MKTSELTGAALDWAVAKCEGVDGLFESYEVGRHHYSTYWAQGGPIIERERIFLKPSKLSPTTSKRVAWGAHGFYGNTGQKVHRHGPTPLIAAMRCYVASKLGDDVDVPEELQ